MINGHNPQSPHTKWSSWCAYSDEPCVYLPPQKKYSPLMYACEGKRTEVVRFLLDNGADVFHTEKVTISWVVLVYC